MYATCLFCHAALGRNATIEHFPVGRRLAYDAEKGRLWVACTACGRWNLTPLEERWEAIEEAERLYRGTRLRVATDNIGLARVGDGLDLVRVGAPTRTEFAAWRYGREFLRRARIWRPLQVSGLLGFIALSAGQRAELIPFGLVMASGATLIAGVTADRWLRPVGRVQDMQGSVRSVYRSHLEKTRLLPTNDGWALRLEHNDGADVLVGPTARRALATLLAGTNRTGGDAAAVARSVGFLTRVQEPDAFLAKLARAVGHNAHGALRMLPRDVALALEMSVHEASERRAMEGELASLEEEWRAAEEIASIADGLFLPAAVQRRMRELRPGGAP